MPVYAYRCDNCGYYFEEKQSFNDDPITDCPNCGSKQSVHRVIQPVGVVFKGSGFYVTDNRGSSKSAAPTASNNGEAGNDSSTEKGSGVKPETKTETKSESKVDTTPSTDAKASGKTKPSKKD